MEKNINEKYFSGNDIFCAAELFSAGVCNLNCKYCYIPKEKFLGNIHKKIIDRIKNGEMLSDLQKVFGNKLQYLSHWGTEPTLTTDLFKDFYDKAVDIFPNLKRVFLSSNFMTDPSYITRFVNEILPQKRSLEIEIQVSIDGPTWITDENRGEGCTKKIIDNLKIFLSCVSDNFHQLSLHLKPTINNRNLEQLKFFEKTKEYYDFFEELFLNLSEILQNKKIKFSNQVDPTLATPDYYSKEDGVNFFHFYLNQKKLAETSEYSFIKPPTNFYENRYLEKVNYYREFFTKNRMFSCSAADSCLGLGDIENVIYACHRCFYLPYEEYKNRCADFDLDVETKNALKRGRHEILEQIGIANSCDELDFVRVLYVNRCFHDFAKHKISCCVAICREMATAGQISKIYRDMKIGLEFSKFINSGLCQLDNVLNSSVMEIPSLSLFRIFGNGFFEDILKRYVSMKGIGE